MANINQILHEKVMGCWHNEQAQSWFQGEPEKSCSKCGEIMPDNPDYLHDPAAYWRLLQKVKGHSEFTWTPEGHTKGFLSYLLYITKGTRELIELLLDQQRGCEAIADFFVPEWRLEGKSNSKEEGEA